jgi:hypothetical protein
MCVDNTKARASAYTAALIRTRAIMIAEPHPQASEPKSVSVIWDNPSKAGFRVRLLSLPYDPPPLRNIIAKALFPEKNDSFVGY